MRYFKKRIISSVLSMMMIASLLPIDAFAADVADEEVEVIVEPSEEDLIAEPSEEDANVEISEDESVIETSKDEVAVSDEEEYADGAVTDVISPDEAMGITKAIVTSAVTGNPAGAANAVLSWGSGKAVEMIFGQLGGSKKEASLQDVLNAISRLELAIHNVQTTQNSQQIDGLLNNNLRPLISKDYKTNTCYAALRRDDQKHASSELTDEQWKQAIQSDLIADLGNGTPKDPNSLINPNGQFDEYTMELWNVMTQPYQVTFDGKSQDLTMMQLWYEHLRYKYHWEHQAYKDWADLQTRCVSLLATTLQLEKASLQARIEIINDYNDNRGNDPYISPSELEVRVALIQDHINELAGYEGVDEEGNSVKYPGLFSEETWNSQYWMYKKRSEEERYYWTHGSEAVFYALVNNQNIPNECKGACIKGLHSKLEPEDCDGIEGYYYNDIDWDAEVVTRYWEKKGFLEYHRNGVVADLVSGQQLKQMYKDYGEDAHLYDIFISPNEGNFQGLDEKGIDKWWFIVYPYNGYGTYFHKTNVTEGQARCSALHSSDATWDWVRLHSYSKRDSWMNHSKHYIGIGVKRYGPETYPNGFSSPKPMPGYDQYDTQWRSDCAEWWPGKGDLTVNFDYDSHKSITQATVDGNALDASMYTADKENKTVSISNDLLAGLEYGEHTIIFECEHGTHTVVFKTADKSPELTLSEDADSVKQYINDTLGKNVEVEVKSQAGANGANETVVTVDGKQVLKRTQNEAGETTDESIIWYLIDESEHVYTGGEIKPAVVVFDGLDYWLSEGTDYTLKYSNNKNAGNSATVTISFIGGYKGADPIKANFTIKPADLTEKAVVADMKTGVTGKVQKPEPTVTLKDSGISVKKEVEYTYQNEAGEPVEIKEAGTYKVVVTPKKGNKNLTGTAKGTVTVIQDKNKILSNAKVKLTPDKYTYTGRGIVPADDSYSVTLNGEQLKKDVDYTVSLSNNRLPGKATVTFTAIEDGEKGLVGSTTATFTIEKGRVLDKSKGSGFSFNFSSKCPYAKGGAKPAVSVKDGESLLEEGVDYTVSYSGNKAVTNGATAKLIVNGKGNYKGKVDFNYEVTVQDLSKMNVEVSDKVESSKGYKDPKVTVTDIDGKKLSVRKDYVFGDDYKMDDNNVVTVSLIGKGAYEGSSKAISYRYIAADKQLNKVSASSIAPKLYTGYEVKLSEAELNKLLYTGKKNDPKYLIYNTDFTVVKYINNDKPGTAKIILKGTGDYGMTKTVTFKIKPKKTK